MPADLHRALPKSTPVLRARLRAREEDGVAAHCEDWPTRVPTWHHSRRGGAVTIDTGDVLVAALVGSSDTDITEADAAVRAGV